MDNNVLVAIERLLILILQHTTENLDVISELLSTLDGFSHFLPLVQRQIMDVIIERLFYFIRFVPAQFQNTSLWNLSEEVAKVRKRAVYCFLIIGSREPTLFHPFFQSIVEKSEFLLNNDMLLNIERTSLLEFLSIIINSMNGNQQLQLNYFNILILARVERDLKEIYGQYLHSADLNNFLKLMGFPNNPHDKFALEHLRKLVHLLKCLLALWSRVTFIEPPVAHVKLVMPILARMIWLLHYIWLPDMKKQLENTPLNLIYTLDETTTAYLLHERLTEEKNEVLTTKIHKKIENPNFVKEERSLRNLINKMREIRFLLSLISFFLFFLLSFTKKTFLFFFL